MFLIAMDDDVEASDIDVDDRFFHGGAGFLAVVWLIGSDEFESDLFIEDEEEDDDADASDTDATG